MSVEVSHLRKTFGQYTALDDVSLDFCVIGPSIEQVGDVEVMLAASRKDRIQDRQGLQVSCPEEIAYGNGWIDAAQLEKLATPLSKNGYGQYLLTLLKRGIVR